MKEFFTGPNQSFFGLQAMILREQIKKFQNTVQTQIDLNILILGPSLAAKDALVRTFYAAYHNNLKVQNKQSSTSQWVKMTALTNNKAYVVGTGQNQKRFQRRNINFQQYCESVNSKTITQFCESFSCLLPRLTMPQCGIKSRPATKNSPVACLFCFQYGKPINQNDFLYNNMLLSNFQERDMKPFVVLIRGQNEGSDLDERTIILRRQEEIKIISHGFNIPRDQIYVLNCYSQVDNRSPNDQINFYALQVLLEVVRQADHTAQIKKDKTVERTSMFSCFD